MPKSVELSEHGIPAGPDSKAWRHFGDGAAGPLVAARIQGYSSAALGYIDVAVDASGNLLAALAADAGITIGTVDQGAPGASAWRVDGSAVTQPVSATSLPLPTGAAKDSTLTDGTQRVGGSVAVTGTFWQATQPVSIASMPSTPVTGTFWQATQPVSGTFWQATQPVSGTFWQATQPVSIASMPSTPVTGTFWQATQPVSIASMPSTPVTGTFWQATQPISGTIGVSGSDGLTTLAATVRTHNSFNELYIRDRAVVALLSEVLFELQQLNLTSEN